MGVDERELLQPQPAPRMAGGWGIDGVSVALRDPVADSACPGALAGSAGVIAVNLGYAPVEVRAAVAMVIPGRPARSGSGR